MKNNSFCIALKESQQSGTAIAAINILNHITARAAAIAAKRAGRPVIMQPSMATVKQYGVVSLANIVKNLRQEISANIILHLDHCIDEELAFACVRAGWDSIMVDYSSKPFDENVALTKRAVDYAHSYGVAVEGEIGIISGVEENIAHKTGRLASLDETLAFIEKTGVDAVAPAIGTAHGLYKEAPKLNFQLVEDLKNVHVPVVVHGGTGLSEEDIKRLIACGAAKINISTALKHTYLNSARDALKDPLITPLKFDLKVETACSEEIEKYIHLFTNKGCE